jgi:polar amino acid transport system ATP-binding protein
MNAVLDVRDLRLSRGSREILRGVSFQVTRGEVVALMGLSGSGKTTVLRAIAKLEPEGRESVRIDGPPAGMVFQFHCLFEHLSVIDNVCLAPVHVGRVARREAQASAARLLDELAIGHRARAFPRELSGGEAQRAAIARALATNPSLLLLDEPTASLDPPRRASLGELLGQLAAAGRAVLVTSHDVEFVRDHAHRVLVLGAGAVVETGAPGVVFDAPTHDSTRELLRADRR